MERKDVIKSSGYWIAEFQLSLYECAERFMREHNMNRTQLAEYLGVSKGYVSQLLNGDYNYSISKMVELALAFGYVPSVDFVPVEQWIELDKRRRVKPNFVSFNKSQLILSDNYINNEPYIKEAA